MKRYRSVAFVSSGLFFDDEAHVRNHLRAGLLQQPQRAQGRHQGDQIRPVQDVLGQVPGHFQQILPRLRWAFFGRVLTPRKLHFFVFGVRLHEHRNRAQAQSQFLLLHDERKALGSAQDIPFPLQKPGKGAFGGQKLGGLEQNLQEHRGAHQPEGVVVVLQVDS